MPQGRPAKAQQREVHPSPQAHQRLRGRQIQGADWMRCNEDDLKREFKQLGLEFQPQLGSNPGSLDWRGTCEEGSHHLP